MVTPAQVEAYVTGKKRGLRAATQLVERGSGGIFTAKTWAVEKSHDPYGANAAIVKWKFLDPPGAIRSVEQVMHRNGYKYMLIGGGYSNLTRSEQDLGLPLPPQLTLTLLLCSEGASAQKWKWPPSSSQWRFPFSERKPCASPFVRCSRAAS
jgi:hypothetical protein